MMKSALSYHERTVLVATAVFFVTLLAQARMGKEERSAIEEQKSGVILGKVVDIETKEPLGWTPVLLLETNKAVTAHEDGTFHFHNVPPGTHSLKTFRLGYESLIRRITVAERETVIVTLELKSSPLSTETVLVLGVANGKASSVKPTEIITGKQLQQQLGRTLAETLSKESGISQRTMGPAPARPVIRGLGGDRLLILEDGGRTGDISATAPDHAVVVDPLTAERVEISRGPAALRYGPNALVGTINVVRGQIPSEPIHHVHGNLMVHGETVNGGLAGGGAVSVPLGAIVLRADGSMRNATDISVPNGVLRNTYYRNLAGSLGASRFDDWGHLGLAAGIYRSQYGIPGGFVGAHPNGVKIELERAHLRAKAEVLVSSSPFRLLEAEFALTDYYHRELEATGVLGIEFGVLTYSGEVIAQTRPWGFFSGGFAGISGEYRDFASGGFSFTPPTREQNLAAFLLQEADLGLLSLKIALRADTRLVHPEEEFESKRIGLIRSRRFSDLSGSLAGVFHLRSSLFAGITFTRSIRPPSVEELYSEGPHLAAYSFEVGNPELDLERGLGLEVFLRYTGHDALSQVTVFHNDLQGYIFPRNSGQINFRTLLPIYRFTGLGAAMSGVELSAEARVVGSFVAGASLNYVRGSLKESQSPLPMMPPLGAKIDLRYSTSTFMAGVVARMAAAQNRIDQFEQPTAGYTVIDGIAQYQVGTGAVFHTFVLTAENVLNTEYRVHLSRVKSIMPEPGRNLKLLYKLVF
ncbi:MAG: TonB-dependent receptor [Ignavibacteria bacterium]|nr:TonB-dependent receptor [Ignavibacteria bacterium]